MLRFWVDMNFFCPYHMACGTLVPWQGSNLYPPHWKCRVGRREFWWGHSSALRGVGHRGDSSGEASFSEASVSYDQHHVLERDLKSWLLQPAERPSANPFAPLSLGFFIGSVGMMASALSFLPGISWGSNKTVAGKALCRSKVTVGVQSSLTVSGCRHGWLVSVPVVWPPLSPC